MVAGIAHGARCQCHHICKQQTRVQHPSSSPAHPFIQHALATPQHGCGASARKSTWCLALAHHALPLNQAIADPSLPHVVDRILVDKPTPGQLTRWCCWHRDAPQRLPTAQAARANASTPSCGVLSCEGRAIVLVQPPLALLPSRAERPHSTEILAVVRCAAWAISSYGLPDKRSKSQSRPQGEAGEAVFFSLSQQFCNLCNSSSPRPQRNQTTRHVLYREHRQWASREFLPKSLVLGVHNTINETQTQIDRQRKSEIGRGSSRQD